MSTTITKAQQEAIINNIVKEVNSFDKEYRSFDLGDGEFVRPMFNLFKVTYDLFVDSDVEAIIKQLMKLLNGTYFGYAHYVNFSGQDNDDEDRKVTINTAVGADSILYLQELFTFLIKADKQIDVIRRQHVKYPLE